jgi:hypothetical protein
MELSFLTIHFRMEVLVKTEKQVFMCCFSNKEKTRTNTIESGIQCGFR